MSGEPTVAASVKRPAGLKGKIDHYGALSFLQGLLVILRDSGLPGLILATPRGLLLAGRTWDIRQIDWRRRRLYVEPTKRLGRSLWLGEGRPLRFEHGQAIRRLLADATSQKTREPHRSSARADIVPANRVWYTGIYDQDESSTVGGLRERDHFPYPRVP